MSCCDFKILQRGFFYFKTKKIHENLAFRKIPMNFFEFIKIYLAVSQIIFKN